MNSNSERRFDPPLLVLLHEGGWTEVIGSPVQVVYVAHVPGGMIGSVDSHRLAYQYLSTTLPGEAVDLLHSGQVIAADRWRNETPTAISNRRLNLELLNTLRAIEGEGVLP